MNLRDYQVECISKVDAGWQQYSKQIIVMATGAGKTVVFASIAAMQEGRTLILAHRDELVNQAIDKVYAVTGIQAGREKGASRALFSDRIVVASVQSMQNRLGRWPENHFRLIVCDEAHRSTSKTWQAVIDHFAKFNRLLGVTATPDRTDGINLGTVYENKAFEISLFQLIKKGYLVPIKVKTCPLKFSLDSVKSRAGDFAVEDIDSVLDPYLDPIAATIRKETGSRRLLCFLPLVKTSLKFRDAIRAQGMTCEHIDGNSKDRTQILERFARGEFQVLSNAMLLTEGFDDPGISAVCNLRPTKSRSLYTQMVGRGTRLAEGKKDLLLIDFLWASERHSLVKPAHLGDNPPEVQQKMIESMEEGALLGGVDEVDFIETEADAVDEVEKQRESGLVKLLEKNKNRKAELLDAEEFARRIGNKEAESFREEYDWQRNPVTEAQSKILTRAGIDLVSVRGMGHASALIEAYTEHQANKPASSKQIAAMKRAGFLGAEVATAKQARQFFAKGGRRYARR